MPNPSLGFFATIGISFIIAFLPFSLRHLLQVNFQFYRISMQQAKIAVEFFSDVFQEKNPIRQRLEDNYFHALQIELRLLRDCLVREDRGHRYGFVVNAVRDAEAAAWLKNRVAVSRAMRNTDAWTATHARQLGATMVAELISRK
jgi:hypothetical protein